MLRIRIRRIRTFLGLLDPDPLEAWLRILLSSSKNSKKNLDSYGTVLLLLFDFLSLKNDINVPSKSNKQKNFFLFVFLLREGQ